MILDLHIALISNKWGNIPSIWVIVLELSFIFLNIIKLIHSELYAYWHYKQYNGTVTVLAEWKLKVYKELERVYVDTSTSTGM